LLAVTRNETTYTSRLTPSISGTSPKPMKRDAIASIERETDPCSACRW
jgi:hypothetical protein